MARRRLPGDGSPLLLSLSDAEDYDPTVVAPPYSKTFLIMVLLKVESTRALRRGPVSLVSGIRVFYLNITKVLQSRTTYRYRY